jgi:hypothetical protein
VGAVRGEEEDKREAADAAVAVNSVAGALLLPRLCFPTGGLSLDAAFGRAEGQVMRALVSYRSVVRPRHRSPLSVP